MERQATIILLDELQCQLTGLSSIDFDQLYDQYGMFIKHHFFQPKVKLGVWDGRVRLIGRDGVTYCYLLDTIVPKLIEREYKIKLVDRRRQIDLPELTVANDIFSAYSNEHGDPYIIRDYQVNGINALLKEHGGILLAGTGAGKSICSAAITKVYGQIGLKVITIVPSGSLVLQSSILFKMLGLDCGQLDGKHKELSQTHLVTTWQSLKNIPTVLLDYDVIIVDECQGTKINVLGGLISKYGKNSVVRIGLTGTMPDYPLDNLTVRCMLGDIRYDIPAHVLITKKYLSTIEIEVMQLQESLDDKYFPDYTAEISYLRTNDQRKLWISRFVTELSQRENGNVLMMVTSKTFGKQFTKMIPGAHFVCGDDVVTDRKVIYDLFKSNSNLVCITTVQVAGTGLSIDRVFNLVLLDLGKSFIRTIQAIGRGLRRDEKAGKVHCDIYDISSSLKYSRMHQSKRVKFYKENNYPCKVTQVPYRVFDLDEIVD
jgi:superfamily II DNA or RNA helicase